MTPEDYLAQRLPIVFATRSDYANANPSVPQGVRCTIGGLPVTASRRLAAMPDLTCTSSTGFVIAVLLMLVFFCVFKKRLTSKTRMKSYRHCTSGKKLECEADAY